MTPYLKLVPHDPANGQYGDCYRTALACLLDVDPSLVPHVMGVDDNWRHTMRLWLATRDLWLVEFPVVAGNAKDALRKVGALNPGVFYLLLGRSANGIGHCVVCNGEEMVHDPNPECLGVAKPLHSGAFFAHVLVPASMTGKSPATAELPPLRRVAE